MQSDGKVFLTGVAGVGKSELVRTYAEKYASEYAHIGYYNYNEYRNGIADIIANVLPNMAFIRSDIEALYEENLELLSAFGKNLLLVIDKTIIMFLPTVTQNCLTFLNWNVMLFSFPILTMTMILRYTILQSSEHFVNHMI